MSDDNLYLVCEGDAQKGDIVRAASPKEAAEYYFEHSDPILKELAVYTLESLPTVFAQDRKVRHVKR